MLRTAVAGIAITLVACAGDAGPAVPAAIVVVTDSLGELIGGLDFSADGRLAYLQTVAGKSAVFVSDAEGRNPVRVSHGVWDLLPMWSPDGRWIAHHSEAPDFDLFVVAAEGGEPRQLTSGPAFDRPSGWLPDGSGVVFRRSGQGSDITMVAPLDGGPLRRLGPVQEGNQHAALSPDGTMLAWDLHQGTSDATIWVQSLPDGEPRQLTTENFENASVPYMWSPDGRSLAYTSRRTGTRDIYVVDVGTGESRQLTTDIRDDYQPRWSPDGRWIAFLSDRGGQVDIWVVPVEGGPARRVTDDAALESAPLWAPDGRAIYYYRSVLDVELQLIPTDSGAPRKLFAWSGYRIPDAALSPDGRTVLFTSNRSGTLDIWSLPVGGDEPSVFAGSPLDEFAPEFSPDGSQVLFFSNRAGATNLWVVPDSGSAARQLTQGPAADQEAEWSPDGTLVAFSSNRDVAGGDLWVIPAAGGEATRLTTGDMRPASLRWSPDQRWIYFSGERAGGGRELYRVAASGGSPQALGANRTIGNPDLSPDGSQVAYSSFEGGWSFVDLMPAAGGPSRRLTPGTENVFQPTARWTPDGTWLIVHDLDLEGNRDALDLSAVRPSDGTWRRLTDTRIGSEVVAGFTPDGTQILVGKYMDRHAVMKVPVADLLATPARP